MLLINTTICFIETERCVIQVIILKFFLLSFLIEYFFFFLSFFLSFFLHFQHLEMSTTTKMNFQTLMSSLISSEKLRLNLIPLTRSPCGAVANVLHCDIAISEFEFQSRYYVHFRTNTLGEGINPSYLLHLRVKFK